MPMAMSYHVSPPYNNINGSLVNVDGSHYSGSAFTSRVIPSTVNPNVLPEPLSNIQAANSYIPCFKGGAKNKKKINNISTMYKMKGGKKSMKKRINRIKRKLMRSRSTKSRSKRRSTRKRSTRKRQRGGYSQYQNNLPMTPTYSLGGKLPSSLSALASPPPQTRLSNCVNCVDNYSHFDNKGFPSRGWH